jgi:intein/homing endonuclease
MPTIYDLLPEGAGSNWEETAEAAMAEGCPLPEGEQGEDVPAPKTPTIYDQLPEGAGPNWLETVNKTLGAGLFKAEWDSVGFADSFLIINDVILTDVPTDAIGIESECGTTVAETLRSRAPIVSSNGIQDMTLTLTLAFQARPTPMRKLHRLVSELQHHPLVYVYNGKVRKSLGISDASVTTMFILETAGLRNDSNQVGTTILDLTLHYFNYRPFSNHFWYNTRLPWLNRAATEPKEEIKLGDLSAYEASAYSLEYAAEKIAQDIRSGSIALNANYPNVPVNMPGASDAWMYYADHLSKLVPKPSDTNSDFVGFKLDVFSYHAPPTNEQRAGKGLIKSLFSDGVNFPPHLSVYDAYGAADTSYGQTATQNAASKAANASKKSGSGGVFSKEVLQWQPVIEKYGAEFGVPPAVAMATIQIESRGKIGSASHTKSGKVTARGIGQFVKGTYDSMAKELNISTPWEESGNPGHENEGIRMCLAYLAKTAKAAKNMPGAQESWGDAHVAWIQFFYGAGEGNARNFLKAHERKFNTKGIDILNLQKYGYTDDSIRAIIIEGLLNSSNKNLVKKGKAWKEKGQGVYPIRRITHTLNFIHKMTGQPLGPMQVPDEELKKQVIEDQKAAGIKPDDEKAQAEAERNFAARKKWIKDMRDMGLYYYWKDPKLRNIFYSMAEYNVSGNPLQDTIASFGSHIVLSAISMTFGHRIVPHKLTGQSAYTWQFLGAGNKTGTLVFTFSGISGRAAADNIKRLIIAARENARQFGGLIQDAGSIELTYDNPYNTERNTIISLMHGDQTRGPLRIVITDFSETSDPSGADMHQMVVNFIIQDFEPEKLDPRIFSTFDQKTRVIKAIMEDLIVAGYLGEGENKQWMIYPNPKHMVFQGYGEGINVRPFRRATGSDMPEWLMMAVYQAAIATTQANQELLPGFDKALFEEFGAAKHLKGSTKNMPLLGGSAALAFSGPDMMGEGLAISMQPDVDKSLQKEFAKINSAEDQRRNSRVFVNWLGSMNVVFERIMQNAQAPDFSKWFGSVGQDQIDRLTQRLGECYADLLLPDVPSGNLPLPPEFYVYEDAYEDAALSALTDDMNMEQFLQMHIRNERASVQHYIGDLLLGGSYISRNLPRIIDTRKNYLTLTGGAGRNAGELGFLSFSNLLTEGTKVWDPVSYRPGDAQQQNADVQAWITKRFGGDTPENTKSKFMDDIIKLTPYLRDGRGELWSGSYNDSNNTALVEALYEQNYQALTFGPNMTYKQCDEVMSGQPVDTKSAAAANAAKQDQQPKNPDPSSPTYAKQTGIAWGMAAAGDSVTVGNTAAENEAAEEQKEEAQEDSGPIDAAIDFIKTWSWEFFTKMPGFGMLLGDAVELYGVTQEMAAEENKEKIEKELNTLMHNSAAGQYAQDKQDSTLAAMARGIGFGAKAKDISIRRAYPTFKIYFIEDDENETEMAGSKTLRAFDDFYSYSAVQEIRVIRSRKVAADLAIIRITNMGGKLLRRRFGEAEAESRAISGVDAENPTGIFADTELENPFANMVLQDGVKVQIRLGYASNPDHLETVFLGSIVEISPTEDGKILEIMCQGFGAELEGVELGPLEDGPIFYTSQSALSGAIIQDSIVNFGRRGKFNRFSMGEARHAFIGDPTGKSGESILSQMTPSAFLASWGTSQMEKHFFRYQFMNYPQDDNIYAPPPYVYASTWTKLWNNACTYRPLKQTPWQIFQEHELRHPGYVSLAVPYGHSARMTMFFGSKGQHYWAHPPSGLELFLSETATDQITRLQGLSAKKFSDPQFAGQLQKIAADSPGLATAIIQGVGSFARPTDVSLEIGKLFGRYRPFRNYHYFDATHHILRNNIRTNVDGTYNEVEVLYFENENDIEEDEAVDLAENIQAMSLGAKGMLACKLDENIPEAYIRSYREEFPSCITEDMARRYVQGLFCRTLRDCYRGELVVLGEPTLKPYDVCVSGDTEIATDKDWRPIKDIAIGDRVVTHTGAIEHVTNWTSRVPTEKVKEITVHGEMDSLIITENHPVYIVPADDIRDRSKPWKQIQRNELSPRFVPVYDIVVGDYALTPIPAFDDECSISFARLLGYYLAEGCVIWENREGGKVPVAVQWSFNINETALAQEVQDSLIAEGYTKCNRYELIEKNELRLIVYSRDLVQRIINSGSFYSRNKTLLIRPKREACLALLGAYLNGDGSIDKKSHPGLLRAVTVSKQLARSLKIALASVGIYSITTKVKAKGYPGTSKHAYMVTIPATESHKITPYTKWHDIELKISHRSYNLRGWIWQNYIVNPITSIVDASCEQVYNISVANDESYVCGFTAVHNCYLNDSSIGMTGPIEVEQVEHIFNRDQGFISIITPDLCVDINDYYSATVTDLVAASMAYTFGLDNPDTAITLSAIASPLSFLAWTAGVKFIKWTQDGVPVITTPLVLGGKPFMSTTLGQKRISMFLAQCGKWTQYWDDLETAWDKMDIAESMFDVSLDWKESFVGFISGVKADNSIPLAEPGDEE